MKRISNNKKVMLAVMIILLGFSCTKNFEDINTNPNSPSEAPLENVFAYVVYSLTYNFGTSEMEYPASYVGHLIKGRYNEPNNYLTPPTSILWSAGYRTISANANFIIEEALKLENNNMAAAAMIIKAYALQMIVDAYGPVPYYEAGLGAEGNVHPVYDREDVIYTELMGMLDEANELLVNEPDNGVLGPGDVLYHGDVMKWKKFCNSLHLRMAIRISNVDGTTASATINKILGDPATYPVFESNADNAEFVFPGGEDWREPWTAQYSSIGVYYMAEPIIKALDSLGDPRLAFYADSLADGSYVGVPVGNTQAGNSASRPHPDFIDNPAGSVFFMKYSEVEFIKAEAAQRGLYGLLTDAPLAYASAITASCEEYGIDAVSIGTYLTSPGVLYIGDTEQIYYQKWISLFRQSWEAWAEMRRTDVPLLPLATKATVEGHNRIPVRFSYPDSEVKLNGDNIPGDVNQVDEYWGYQIWWDTRTGVQ